MKNLDKLIFLLLVICLSVSFVSAQNLPKATREAGEQTGRDSVKGATILDKSIEKRRDLFEAYKMQSSLRSFSSNIYGGISDLDHSIEIKPKAAPFAQHADHKTFLSDSATTTNPQKIVADDGMPLDFFGGSIASDGNTLVIGASQDTVGDNAYQGSAYIFFREGSNWVQKAKITASDGAYGDNFGFSVAVHGDTVAVGSPSDDSLKGSIYIFKRTGTIWTEQTKLIAADGGFNDFGKSLAMDQNILVAGAVGDRTGSIFNHGAAYIFTNENGNWSQKQKIKASDFAAGDNFGISVDIDRDTIIIGAGLDDIGSNANQGSAYIFTKSADGWIEQAKLTASDGAESDFFGLAVAISGDTAVIGAPGDEAPTLSEQGSAYVFVRQNGVWNEQTKLTDPKPYISDRFGNYVDIDGNSIIIGVLSDDVDGNIDQGSAFLFTRVDSNWLPPIQLLAPDAAANDRFGFPTVISGNQIFIGKPAGRLRENIGSVYYYLQPLLAPDLRETSDSGISNSDNITNSRNLVFDVGGVTTGAVVEFLRNGEVIASTTATERIVTFTDSSTLADGNYEYSARQIINGETGTISSTQVTIDTTAPVITIDLMPGQSNVTSGQPIIFTLLFSEPLPNFSSTLISLAGSTADVSSAQVVFALDGTSYRIVITNILSDGIVKLNIPAGIFSDAAGNLNLASINTNNSIILDTIGPSVTINQANDQADPTAALPVKYTVVFSEPVNGFDWQDISSAGSATFDYSASNIIVEGSGATYTVSISGVSSNGQYVQPIVRRGAVRDAAGNISFESTSTDNRVTVDNVSPSVRINQAVGQSDPTSNQPVNFSVIFSEPVTGFDSTDVSLVGSNANVSVAKIVITGSSMTYNVSVSNIVSGGLVRASIPANTVQDVLGNQNNASTSSDNTILLKLNRVLFDFDGDGKADISVFRPNNGVWYLLNSTSGFTAAQFGVSTDKIVPADYDGDGKTDLAVYRNGTWYIQRSLSGFTGVAFGTAEDIPQSADFDGDGKADLAVYRPSNGVWYVYNLATNQFTGAQFGASADKPVVGDYNGDGKADYAVFRPSNGIWYIARPTGVPSQNFDSIQFGEANDKPVPADYDGDGKTDVGVFRPSNGSWYLQRSTAGFTSVQFGISTDSPAPADYDGDGKADVAVFRSGTWYLNRSTAGFTGVQFGISTDKPVPNTFVP